MDKYFSLIYFHECQKISHKAKFRGGSRNLATSKMELLFEKRLRIKAVNYCHKELHLRCCNSPRSASEIFFFPKFLLLDIRLHISLYETQIKIDFVLVNECASVFNPASKFTFL